MKEGEKMEFSEKLKELRSKNELTQIELAEILSIHSMTISRWERGIAFPDARAVIKLAMLFSISTDELLCVNEGVDV